MQMALSYNQSSLTKIGYNGGGHHCDEPAGGGGGKAEALEDREERELGSLYQKKKQERQTGPKSGRGVPGGSLLAAAVGGEPGNRQREGESQKKISTVREGGLQRSSKYERAGHRGKAG